MLSAFKNNQESYCWPHSRLSVRPFARPVEWNNSVTAGGVISGKLFVYLWLKLKFL